MSAWWGKGEQALVTLVLLWISVVAVIPSSAGILALRLGSSLSTEWSLRAEQEEVDARYADIEIPYNLLLIQRLFHMVEYAKSVAVVCKPQS